MNSPIKSPLPEKPAAHPLPRGKPVLIGAILIVAVGLTIASGILQGRIRNRWGPSAAVLARASQLDQLPERIGPWKRVAKRDLSGSTIHMLECSGYHYAKYQHESENYVILAAVMLGPPGPISVHTPEICYSSREFKLINNRRRIAINPKGAKECKLWVANFESRLVEGNLMRVAYGWSTDGDWKASESARYDFAGGDHLFKVQIAAPLPADYDIANGDPIKIFSEDFFAELNRTVFNP